MNAYFEIFNSFYLTHFCIMLYVDVLNYFAALNLKIYKPFGKIILMKCENFQLLSRYYEYN